MKGDDCFQSFRIRNDSIWQQCLGLCGHTDEKVMMYFLRAIRPRSDALVEMKEMYALDRSSSLLEFLLVREVAKLEEELIGIPEQYPPAYRRGQRESSLTYLEGLNSFIATCVKDREVRQPEVWKLAEGYTDCLVGRAGEARALFPELKKGRVVSVSNRKSGFLSWRRRSHNCRNHRSENLQADPFSGRINDCRDCDFKIQPADPYTKRTLAERLLTLQQKIREHPDSAAQFHLLLGNAYYNLTHFGNSSEALDYNRNPEFGWLQRSVSVSESKVVVLRCVLNQWLWENLVKPEARGWLCIMLCSY